MRSIGCKDHKDSVSSQRSSFTNVYPIHSAEKTWRLKRAYILTATLSTWNKFAYEGMNVYSLAADGDCHWKRICHYALATKTNRVMMLAVLWKKMLLKSARNFDSVPWLSTHLLVFNFMKGNWNLISCWTCEHDSFVLILFERQLKYPGESYFRARALPICGNPKDCTSRSVRCFLTEVWMLLFIP